MKGHEAVVRLLIKEKADVNIYSKVLSVLSHLISLSLIQDSQQGGFTPVYAASREGHTGVVDLLVKAGADIHRANIEVHIIIIMYILLPMLTESSSSLHYKFKRRQGVSVKGGKQRLPLHSHHKKGIDYIMQYSPRREHFVELYRLEGRYI